MMDAATTMDCHDDDDDDMWRAADDHKDAAASAAAAAVAVVPMMDQIPPRERIIDVIRNRLKTSYMSKFHIDSFNVFLRKHLPEIIREYNYGCCEGYGKRHEVFFDHVTVHKPYMKEKDGTVHKVFPHQARMRDLTYEGEVTVNVKHVVTDVCTGTTETRVYRDQCIAHLPIMLMSEACWYTDYPDMRNQFHCAYDPGGYFIIKGMSKVIVTQQTVAPNRLIITRQKGLKYVLQGEIRSRNESKMRSTSTLRLHVTRTKGGALPCVVLSVPFLLDLKLSLHVAFRFLGVDTSREQMVFICGRVPREDSTARIDQLVRAAVADENYESASLDDLYAEIGRLGTSETVFEKRVRAIKNIFTNEFLPHMGIDAHPDTFKRKAFYLGRSVMQIMRVYNGDMKPDDEDHVANKRFSTSGVLMAYQFRLLMRQFQRHMMSTIYSAVNRGGGGGGSASKRNNHGTDDDALNYKNVNVISAMKEKKITGPLHYAMASGNWGIRRSTNTNQKGVTQVLERMNVPSMLSHLRRINVPLTREGRNTDPRQVHGSHWMAQCPVETPEGSNCGLLKNMALIAHLRVGCASAPVEALLRACGVKHLLHCDEADLSSGCWVMLNGDPVGITHAPEAFVDAFRKHRRAGNVPRDVSIAACPDLNEVRVGCDAGAFCTLRLVAPMVHEFRRVYETYMDCPDALLEQMLSAGVIEYVDKEEERNCRIAVRPEDLAYPVSPPYTHAELSPELMLGVCATTIPFPDHNQSPRNIYQASMMKAAVALPFLNYQQHMESKMHVLVYPQRPLAASSAEALLGMPPAGQNAIVAVICLDGYNEEDAMYMNLSAVERGLFRSVYYYSYKESERIKPGESVLIAKPDGEVKSKRRADYSKLNPHTGVADPGTLLHPGDVIIGKVMQTKMLDKGADAVCVDQSVIVKGDEPVTVDSVVFTTNASGDRMVKVRTRSTRTPSLGDKFSSRHGQKGVVGKFVSQEDMPFTSDGICPDIIINAHCLAGSTRVLRSDGMHSEPIQNLREQSDVFSVDCNHARLADVCLARGARASNVFVKLPSEPVLCRVVTRSGHAIVCTVDHQVMVVSEHDYSGNTGSAAATTAVVPRRADCLRPGLDRLVVVHTTLPVSDIGALPTNMSFNTAVLLARVTGAYARFGMYCDSTLAHFRLPCAADARAFVEDVSALAVAVMALVRGGGGGGEGGDDDDDDDDDSEWICHAWKHHVSPTAVVHQVEVKGPALIHALEELGVWTDNSSPPQWLRDSPLSIQRQYVSACWGNATHDRDRSESFTHYVVHVLKALNVSVHVTGSAISGMGTLEPSCFKSLLRFGNVMMFPYDCALRERSARVTLALRCAEFAGVDDPRNMDDPVSFLRVGSRNDQHMIAFAVEVHDVSPVDPEPVYDFTTTTDSHTFVANGILVHNCMPSRMTIAHLLESFLSLLVCVKGDSALGDATPFQVCDENHPLYKLNGDQLRSMDPDGAVQQIVDAISVELKTNHQMDPFGDQVMYSGTTGELLTGRVFIAPTFYQRLHHMPIDKGNARESGARTILTRQPVQGRQRHGGLKFGEMERDALIGNGAASILEGRMSTLSDITTVIRCNKCGFSAESAPPESMFYAGGGDGETSSPHFCRLCNTGEFCVPVNGPHVVFNVFSSYMHSCGIFMRMKTEPRNQNE